MIMNTYQKQKGVALVVSLIILVSLTMLGMTAMQRTTTDLTMAGNQRESGLMFRSAEVGLVSAENYLDDIITNADFDGADGLIEVDPTDATYLSPDYFDDASWTVGNSTEAPTNLVSEFGIPEEPRYMIEYLGDRSQNPLAAINIGGGYGSQQTGDIVSIYRSTARGTGLTGNTYRYVQSYFGKQFD